MDQYCYGASGVCIKDKYMNTFFTDVFDNQYGHKKSFESKSSINSRGKPVPWYTYPFVDFLDCLDLKKKKVFEYGSGNGSLYFAKKAKKVVTVDHDEFWSNKIKAKKIKTLKSYCFEVKKDYINSIDDIGGKYDIIVIDGKYRLPCANLSVKHLNKNGFIILDNSDWYRQTAKFLRSKGFNQIDFTGFGPINYYAWTTSLFLNSSSKIEYLKEAKFHRVKGGQIVYPKDEK